MNPRIQPWAHSAEDGGVSQATHELQQSADINDWQMMTTRIFVKRVFELCSSYDPS